MNNSKQALGEILWKCTGKGDIFILVIKTEVTLKLYIAEAGVCTHNTNTITLLLLLLLL